MMDEFEYEDFIIYKDEDPRYFKIKKKQGKTDEWFKGIYTNIDFAKSRINMWKENIYAKARSGHKSTTVSGGS